MPVVLDKPAGTQVVKYEILLADIPHAHLVHQSNPEYKKVYEGQIETSDKDIHVCEMLFAKFNVDHPEDYKERSMSLGDRITIIRGKKVTKYECAHFSWLELK
jgi:hypothetical protein